MSSARIRDASHGFSITEPATIPSHPQDAAGPSSVPGSRDRDPHQDRRRRDEVGTRVRVLFEDRKLKAADGFFGRRLSRTRSLPALRRRPRPPATATRRWPYISTKSARGRAPSRKLNPRDTHGVSSLLLLDGSARLTAPPRWCGRGARDMGRRAARPSRGWDTDVLARTARYSLKQIPITLHAVWTPRFVRQGAETSAQWRNSGRSFDVLTRPRRPTILSPAESG